jgi:putative oxidoreductase
MVYARPATTPAPDAGLLILRLGLAAILLFHGIYKVTHGVGWIAGPLGRVGLPAFLAYGVYIAEILAPVLLIIGLWTRIAALVVAFSMAMAIFLARSGDVMKVNPMGGGWAIELEMMLLVAAIALALAGGGRYSIGGGRR